MNKFLEQIIATSPIPVIGERKAMQMYYDNIRKEVSEKGQILSEKHLLEMARMRTMDLRSSLYIVYSVFGVVSYSLTQIIF